MPRDFVEIEELPRVEAPVVDPVDLRRRELIRALRDGRYQQTWQYLRYGRAFCAAGVMCDLYDATGWERSVGEVYAYRGERAEPPHDVVSAYDMAPTLLSEMIEFNDATLTFSDIADWLESEWELA